LNKNYECMVLLDNREVRQGWDTLKDNVAGMLTKHGASIISSRVWEERKLAFPIQRQLRGTYLLVYFDAPTNEITPINRELEMAEPVMRHLVTVCDEIPESAHEPEKEFDVNAIGKDPEPAPAEAPATEAAKAPAGAAAAEPAATEAKTKEPADSEAPAADAPAAEAPAAEAGTAETGTAEKGTAETGTAEKGTAETATVEKSDAPAAGDQKEDS
jgi:small subunit ribosomal protein S6